MNKLLFICSVLVSAASQAERFYDLHVEEVEHFISDRRVHFQMYSRAQGDREYLTELESIKGKDTLDCVNCEVMAVDEPVIYLSYAHELRNGKLSNPRVVMINLLAECEPSLDHCLPSYRYFRAGGFRIKAHCEYLDM